MTVQNIKQTAVVSVTLNLSVQELRLIKNRINLINTQFTSEDTYSTKQKKEEAAQAAIQDIVKFLTKITSDVQTDEEVAANLFSDTVSETEFVSSEY